jgi:hypothetical protein
MEWPPDPDPYALDSEVLELLTTLAEASQAVARAQRRFFVRQRLSASAAVAVFGAGLEGSMDAAPQDLRSLRDENLIECENYKTNGQYEFFVTRLGYTVVEELRRRGEPQEAAEEEIGRYVDASEFAAAYLDAQAKLRSARHLAAIDPGG